MNQAILFNDDFSFDKQQSVWSFTALLSGQVVTIYVHSTKLKQLKCIDNETKFDIEEIVEQWLENNEYEKDEIHINMR